MRRRPAPFLAAAFVALCLPALAPAQEKPATPPVTIYGTLNVNLQSTMAGGATAANADVKSRLAISTDSTNLGVRGGLDVNEWVGATYQCETSANVNGVGPSGICNRNSRLGITGKWGTLWYGNWDTPFKALAYGTKADDPFLNTDVFGYQGIMGSPGFNYRSGSFVGAPPPTTGANAGVSESVKGFDVRAQDSVGYWSPKFEGLGVKLQYSVNQFMTSRGGQNPSLLGAAVNWDYMGFSVMAAYERHDDSFALAAINGAASVATPGNFGATAPNTTGTNTAGVSSSDWAWRVGAGYELNWQAGATTLGVMVDQLDLQQGSAPAGAVTEYKRLAWQVALKHRAGDHEIRARYSQAGKGDVTLNGGGGSTDGYGASMLALGYAYYFAKNFQGYLSYAQITNDANAQYTFGIGGSSAVAGNTPKGAGPFALGLGLRYAF